MTDVPLVVGCVLGVFPACVGRWALSGGRRPSRELGGEVSGDVRRLIE